MVFDREKARQQLLQRTKESYDRREGGIHYRYFKSDSALPLYNPKPTKDDPHIIDILPYSAGNNYPLIDGQKVIKKGDAVYKIDIEVHQYIGPSKAWIICPAKNYGLKCPICEDVDARLAAGEEWDMVKDIATKRRCVFNVIVYDGKNDEKVQVWEVSHKYSDKPILLQAKSPRTGGVEPFSDPDVGKSISFEIANDEYKTIQGHKLLPRDYTIPDTILDKCYVLDDEVVIMDYDQIINIYRPSEPLKEQEEPKTESRRPREPISERESTKSRCPHEYVFGEDIDKKTECGKCRSYDPCAEEADKLLERIKNERKKRQAEATVGNSEQPTGTVASQRKLRRPTVTTEGE